MSQKALKWQKMEHDEALLLRGSELSIAENWLSEAEKNNKKPPATELQQQFIGASGELRDRIEQEKIAQEKEKENRRKRDIRNTRLIAVGSSVAFAVSSILAVIAWNKTNEAELNLTDSYARYSLSLLAEGKDLDAFVKMK
ncbi:MAG: hypothetical protein WBM32_08570 [Crocosphaera sp.]